MEIHLLKAAKKTDLKEDKIQKAVDLSAETYCGVMEMFRKFSTLKIGVHFHESEA